jgi:Ca-activated chloride channel family protein
MVAGLRRAFAALSLVCCVLGASTAFAQDTDETDDRTLSPYFFVHGDGATEQLPLKSTDVGIDIAGVIADVRVTQRYRNTGTKPIEAEYVFPGSTRAAVYALAMTIGERRVEAEIREKQQARAEYQAAKAAGQSAALLEQHRPNVFKMNVANIMPGDEIVVELRYTELIVPTDGTYELVFPTVVGPRYVSRAERATPAAAADRWQANPTLHAGVDPPGEFKLRGIVNTGIPIKQMGSPSHELHVKYSGPKHAEVEMLDGAARGANRDFILRYQLAGDTIESGLMLYEAGGEKYFLAMIEPPRRVTAAQIPPRDYLFVLDVSGSMNGFPLEVAKRLMRNLLSGLRPQDTFNVLLFAGDAAEMSPTPLPATPQNVQRALALTDMQSGGGGTELLGALRHAFDMPGGENRSRSVVIVTDGYVSVEKDTYDLIRARLGEANVYAFGIGSSVNRYIIEGMAHVGGGVPFIVTRGSDADACAEDLRRYIESPVLTHTKLSAQGFELHDVEPPGIPDTLASRPVIVFGKWSGARTGTLSIDGLAGDGKFHREFDLAKTLPSRANGALRYLWARNRIARLDDYRRAGADTQAEVTQLGLEYHLLTEYTSFLAIDKVVRNPRPDDAQTVRQPLPMPEQVSDLAVGEPVPTSPEPEVFALLGVAGAVAAWARRRRKRSDAA